MTISEVFCCSSQIYFIDAVLSCFRSSLALGQGISSFPESCDIANSVPSISSIAYFKSSSLLEAPPLTLLMEAQIGLFDRSLPRFSSIMSLRFEFRSLMANSSLLIKGSTLSWLLRRTGRRLLRATGGFIDRLKADELLCDSMFY